MPRVTVGVLDIGAFERGSTGVPSPTLEPPPSTPVTLRPVADGFVRDGTHAATNFGASTVLDVKTDAASGFSRDAYLRFDLGTLASIGSAKLRLYVALSAADAVTATIYPATGTWSESTLTWNTRPGYVSTSPLGALTATTTAAAWREVDITAHVRVEFAASRRVVNLALHAGAASVEKLVVAAREAAGNRPELVITP